MIQIVAPSIRHIGPIAHGMRGVDRMETAAFGFTPKGALRRSLSASVMAATALLDGIPIAMFGCAPQSEIDGVGNPWFLGTDAVASCAGHLLSHGPLVITKMHARYRTLENRVCVDNGRAIRLLRRWGFEIGENASETGGVMFVPFRRID